MSTKERAQQAITAELEAFGQLKSELKLSEYKFAGEAPKAIPNQDRLIAQHYQKRRVLKSQGYGRSRPKLNRDYRDS